MSEEHRPTVESEPRVDPGRAPASGIDDGTASAEPDQRLLRALADLDNLRKRYARELVREQIAERGRVAQAWLPVVDDLERALAYVADSDAVDELDAVSIGVRAVFAHALAVLDRLGFPRFEDLGEPFDPARHEAVGAVESELPTGSIVATTRPGYGRGEDVLRPASVLVSRGTAGEGHD